MDFNEIINRAKAILLSPKTEWPIIAERSETAADIYKNYLIVLAALPAVAGFIKISFIGINVPFAGTMKIGIVSGLINMVVGYVLSLVGIFVVAIIVDMLAPRFGGQKNQTQALKTVAYASTAASVAGLGQLIPGLGTLIVIAGALYSLYLLYLGLPVTMKAPPDKATGYTGIVIVATLIVGFLASLVFGGLGTGSHITRTASKGSDFTFDKNSPLGKIEQASKEYEEAQKSGDEKAQQKAMGEMMSTVFGGGDKDVEALAPDKLKIFVPEKLAGLSRSSMSVERNAAMGMQVSQADAIYSDGDSRRIRLEIVDMGGAKGFMAMAAWAAFEQERQTDNGYEKTYKDGKRIVHEEWNGKDKEGKFTVVVGERFSVAVSGPARKIDDLREAAEAIDLDGLEKLKNEGIKGG